MYYNSMTFLIFQLKVLIIVHKKQPQGNKFLPPRPDQEKENIFLLLCIFHTDPGMPEDDFTDRTTPLYDFVQHFLFLSVKVACLF